MIVRGVQGRKGASAKGEKWEGRRVRRVKGAKGEGPRQGNSVQFVMGVKAELQTSLGSRTFRVSPIPLFAPFSPFALFILPSLRSAAANLTLSHQGP